MIKLSEEQRAKSISLLVLFVLPFSLLPVDAKDPKRIQPNSPRSKKRLPLYSWNSRTGARDAEKLQQWEKWRTRLTLSINDKLRKVGQHWNETGTPEPKPEHGAVLGIKFVVNANRQIENFSMANNSNAESPLSRAINHTIAWASFESSLEFPTTDENAIVSVRGVCIFENPLRFEPSFVQLSYLAPERPRDSHHAADKFGMDYSRNPPIPLQLPLRRNEKEFK